MKSELKHCGYSRFQKKDTDFAYSFVKEACAKVPLAQVWQSVHKEKVNLSLKTKRRPAPGEDEAS